MAGPSADVFLPAAGAAGGGKKILGLSPWVLGLSVAGGIVAFIIFRRYQASSAASSGGSSAPSTDTSGAGAAGSATGDTSGAGSIDFSPITDAISSLQSSVSSLQSQVFGDESYLYSAPWNAAASQPITGAQTAGGQIDYSALAALLPGDTSNQLATAILSTPGFDYSQLDTALGIPTPAQLAAQGIPQIPQFSTATPAIPAAPAGGYPGPVVSSPTKSAAVKPASYASTATKTVTLKSGAKLYYQPSGAIVEQAPGKSPYTVKKA